MTIDDIRSMVSDLSDVETRSIGSDRDASEAAQWIDLAKKTEADTDALLDPAIKMAFTEHRKLTTAKKSLLDKLLAAKDRVRINLANWIAGGHEVKGCYIKRKFKVTVTDQGLLPEEYLMTMPDMEALQKWADLTEGKQPILGCSIEPVNVLYAREQ